MPVGSSPSSNSHVTGQVINFTKPQCLHPQNTQDDQPPRALVRIRGVRYTEALVLYWPKMGVLSFHLCFLSSRGGWPGRTDLEKTDVLKVKGRI